MPTTQDIFIWYFYGLTSKICMFCFVLFFKCSELLTWPDYLLCDITRTNPNQKIPRPQGCEMSSTCPLIWEFYFSSSGFFLFLFKSQIYSIAVAVQWCFSIFDAVVCFFGIGLPGLELTMSIEQVGLQLMEICLLLPPDCWGQRHAPPFPAILVFERGPVTVSL